MSQPPHVPPGYPQPPPGMYPAPYGMPPMFVPPVSYASAPIVPPTPIPFMTAPPQIISKPPMSGPILPPPTPPPISIMTIQPPNRYPLLEDRKITLVANKINEIVDNEELQRLFEACGLLESFRRLRDPKTNIYKTFGYVEYRSAESALTALRVLQDLRIEGSRIELKVGKETEAFLEEYKRKKLEFWAKERRGLDVNDPDVLHEQVEITDIDRDTLSHSESLADDVVRENIYRILEDRKSGNITLSEELAVKNTVEKLAATGIPEEETENKRLIITDQIRKFRQSEKNREKEKIEREKIKQAEQEREKQRQLQRQAERERERQRQREIEEDRERRRREHELRRLERAERQREESYDRYYNEDSDEEYRRRHRSDRHGHRDRKRRRYSDDYEREERSHEKEEKKPAQEEESVPIQPPPPQQPPAPLPMIKINPIKKNIPIEIPIMTSFPEEEEEEQPVRKSSTLSTIQAIEEERRREEEERERKEEELRRRVAEIEKKRKENEKLLDPKYIKRMVPKKKEELLSFEVNWDIVDQYQLISRIKSYLAKKIRDTLGDDEPTMMDFILTKMELHSPPRVIIDEIEGALGEEDATRLVLKVWRKFLLEVVRSEREVAVHVYRS